MVGLEPLTEKEELVLGLIKQIDRPIGEHEFHMLMSITQNAMQKSYFEFGLDMWEKIDERFKTDLGHIPVSKELHEQVESLVCKKYLSRDKDNPLVIFENKYN